MSFRAECPHCGAKYTVGENLEGKRTTCKQCDKAFQITRPVAEPVASPVFDPSIISAEPVVRWHPAARRHSFLSALIGISCLIAGYYIGREHLKYQLRSQVAKIGEEFEQNMRKGLAQAFMPHAAQPAQEPKQIPNQKLLPISEVIRTPEFEMTFRSAAIEHPKLQTISGEGYSTKPCLMIRMNVKNVHPRKLLRGVSDGRFDLEHFSLLDDYGNNIRNISRVFEDIEFIGPSADIGPGESAVHTLLYRIPPAQTKHLVLTIDHQNFGSEGASTYKIPIAQVSNFPPTKEVKED